MSKKSALALIVFLSLTGGAAHAQAAAGEELLPASVKEKFGYIDRAGNLVIRPHFSRADGLRRGLALVAKAGLVGLKWCYIDKTGRSVWESKA